MGRTTSWIISILLAAIGAYWIYVELGLEEKTWFLYLGIAFVLPLLFFIGMWLTERVSG